MGPAVEGHCKAKYQGKANDEFDGNSKIALSTRLNVLFLFMSEHQFNVLIAVASALLGGLFGGFFAAYFSRKHGEKDKKQRIEAGYNVIFEDLYNQIWALKEAIRQYDKILKATKSGSGEVFEIMNISNLYIDTFLGFSKTDLFDMFGSKFIEVVKVYKAIEFFAVHNPVDEFARFNTRIKEYPTLSQSLREDFCTQLDEFMTSADKLISGITQLFDSGIFPNVKTTKMDQKTG